jgi:phosphate transport system substrate-binding protein
MSKRFWRSARIALAAVLALTVSSPARAERIALGGTGSATELLRRLGQEFGARTGIDVEVIAGMGSSGALRAAGDGILDVVVAGQPLSEADKAKGLNVAYTLRTPFVFATSQPTPPRMSMADILRAYTTSTAVWPDGEPIRVILRPKLDSDTTVMEGIFPGFAEALAAARSRPDVPVAATDQDNAALAERTPGSLVGTTYLQVNVERRNLRLVTLDGVEPTMENFERGLYRHAKNLSFVLTANPKPAAQRFVAFVRSPEGEAMYRLAHGH